MQQLGYKSGAKGVVTPGMKPQGSPEEDETLSVEDCSRFRAMAARANYFGTRQARYSICNQRVMQRNE